MVILSPKYTNLLDKLSQKLLNIGRLNVSKIFINGKSAMA